MTKHWASALEPISGQAVAAQEGVPECPASMAAAESSPRNGIERRPGNAGGLAAGGLLTGSVLAAYLIVKKLRSGGIGEGRCTTDSRRR
jgi:hypothetical protein